MPINSMFVMRYAHLMNDESLAAHVKLTLKKMAFGGIYDHIGGGFARYAVDGVWHVPHFEKMLYDNGQLVALYAEAYTWNPDRLYKVIVDETITFISRELTSPENGFYSALDADSEGKEGKFYIFTKAEIEEILGTEADLFNIYYHVTAEGNWEEEESNVFFRKEENAELADRLGLSVEELVKRVNASRQKVLEARSKRIRPGLDNKILASWNGLMLKGLCEGYRTFNVPGYLELALKNAQFVTKNLITGAKIRRVYKNESSGGVAGTEVSFLDDYANVIDAFIALYEVTFDETWLIQAQKLADYTLAHYYNQEGGVFFYTGDNDEQLIARKSEMMDGVIPASNSVMARNLKKLGLFFDNDGYLSVSAQLLRNIVPHLAKYSTAYANWTMLLLDEVFGTYEVAITGNDAEAKRLEMERFYVPNKIILGGKDGSLPLLAERFGDDTRIFVCKDKTCGLPSYNIENALKQINN
jgi:uncharacterized protein YyaL (SSP411 family)